MAKRSLARAARSGQGCRGPWRRSRMGLGRIAKKQMMMVQFDEPEYQRRRRQEGRQTARE